jgi:peptidyl-Asp metalloendopeptidase
MNLLILSIPTRLRHFLAAALSTTAACLITSSTALAKAPASDFLAPAKSSASDVAPAEAIEGRARPVIIHVHQLFKPRFQIRLFNDESLWVERDSLTVVGDGNLVWTGRIANEPLSRVTLALRRGVLSGVIDRAMDNGNELYEIVRQKNGRYILFQVDEDLLPQGDHSEYDASFSPKLPNARGGRPGPASDPSLQKSAGTPVIDLMVVYTPASRARYGLAGIEARIVQAVADANTTFQNSLIDAQINLVHMSEINYTETGSNSQALTALRNPADGQMDEVHALRDQHGADMVFLVSEDTNACGIAYVMTNPSAAFHSYAFGVVYSTCLTTLTLSHEIAHIMGAQHDRTSTSALGAYPYSYGFRRCVNDGAGFRCVMSNACSGGTRINYHSNPNLTFLGHPLGIDYDTNPAQSADNARTINNTASIVAAFRSSNNPAPDAPSNLTVTSLDYSQVSLGWTDNASNETSFHIERSENGGASFNAIASVPANTTTFQDTTVMNGSSYIYQVRAYNGSSASDPSNTVTAHVPELTTPPQAAYGITAQAIDMSRIDIQWIPGDSHATGFVVERAVESGSFSPLTTVDATTTVWSDLTVDPSTTYHYRIVAFNAHGNADASDVATASTPGALPATPVNVSGTALNTTSIRINWTHGSSNADGFIVYSYNGSTWTAIANVGPEATSFTNTGLKRNTLYYYFMVSYNAAGMSPPSNVISVRTTNK